MLAVLVAMGVLREADRTVLDLVQSFRATWLDLFSSAVSTLGQAEVTAGIALGLAVARWRRRMDTATVPLLLAVVTAIEVALKLTVSQPPPPDELSRSVELVPFVHARFPGAFPSGHVARTAFLVGVARLPPWVALLAVALMMVTRVYLADHWPSDVLGGLLLGVLVAQLAGVAEWRLRRH
ncbi:MAG: phosphatase PAP2 family protein [Candidatus Limnocylindria bacterium]